MPALSNVNHVLAVLDENITIIQIWRLNTQDRCSYKNFARKKYGRKSYSNNQTTINGSLNFTTTGKKKNEYIHFRSYFVVLQNHKNQS